MSNIRLNSDDEMIERMELDLIAKAREAFFLANAVANVQGVYSLEDLERMNEEDLCKKVGVGVGYVGSETFSSYDAPLNVAPGGPASKMLNFLFGVILAVPYGEGCQSRHSATKLLTILRRTILGSTVSGDSTNRTWAFVKEAPNVGESTETMLYYSQVWRLAMPVSN